MKPYFVFQWHITDECDQRCIHCYIFSEDNNICLKQMKYEEMKTVVSSCINMCKRLERTPYFILQSVIRFYIKIFGNFVNC